MHPIFHVLVNGVVVAPVVVDQSKDLNVVEAGRALHPLRSGYDVARRSFGHDRDAGKESRVETSIQAGIGPFYKENAAARAKDVAADKLWDVLARVEKVEVPGDLLLR